MEQQIRNRTTNLKWNNKQETVTSIKFNKQEHLSLQDRIQWSCPTEIKQKSYILKDESDNTQEWNNTN